MLFPDSDTAKRLAGVRLVLMDVDGTLVTGDKNSIENVLVQLRRLRPLGIRFSLATGRTIRGAASLAQQLLSVRSRMPPMLTYNGAVVVSGKDSRLITRYILDKNIFSAIIEKCRAESWYVRVYACRMQFDLLPVETVYSEGPPRTEFEFNGAQIQFVDDLLNVDDDFIGVLIDIPPGPQRSAAIEYLRGRFKGALNITASGTRFVEICSSDASKAQGMAELARMWSFPISSVMAIGDNFNDLEMIEQSGVGVAVANAPPEVLTAARIRCTRPAAEGVVEVLRDLVDSVTLAKKSGLLAPDHSS